MERLSRRSFVKIAGAATGAAALAAAPPIARGAIDEGAQKVDPTARVPEEPVVAYVRDALPEITYQFRFNTTLRNEDTFLYNTGPIESLDSDNWNKRQFYDVSVIRGHGPGMNGKKQHHEQDGKGKKLNHDPLACPPCNV